MPYLGDVNLTEQYPGIVEHRYETRVALAYDVDKLSERHVRIHRHKVLLNHAVKAHQCEHRVVRVVGDELALPRQPHTVDAVRLEDDYGEVGAHADNHKRQEEGVSARYLGYEEYARERRVHHSRHHSGHAEQGEVLLRHVDTYLVGVPDAGEEEAAEAAHEEARGERTAATAAAVGGRGGEHLGQHHQQHLPDEHSTVAGVQ